jgi:hypothetical protein
MKERRCFMSTRQETMTHHTLFSHGTVADYITAAGFALAVFAGIAAALSGLGYRLGWWHFTTGFATLRIAAYCGLGAATISLIGGLAVSREHHQSLLFLAVAGILSGLVIAGVPWTHMRIVQEVPRIHDITTDTVNPPVFVSILPLRRDAPNSALYEGPALAAVQVSAYPDIRPLFLPEAPDAAFPHALMTARNMGWRIVDANSALGRIEAIDTTFWYGFKDDIVVRITPASGGSRIDVRSVSRVGKSDVGTNAGRIRSYLRELAEAAVIKG